MFLCHFPGGARSGIIAPMRGSGPEISDGEFKPGGTLASEHWFPNTSFLANSKAAECREVPVFNEHDQWLASCRRRFSETAPAHHARKAWRCRAYYD
jgi:hypothetical protein